MIYQPFEDDIDKNIVLNSAIRCFGKEKQQTVAIEEMAELMQQLSKMIINHHNKSREKLVEEFSDVLIMLCQIKIIYSINQDEVENIQSQKIERISKYIFNEVKKQGAVNDNQSTI
jgi:uncharacterized protein YabN with tetrapyrrole methylase and pyrophosphatase domain